MIIKGLGYTDALSAETSSIVKKGKGSSKMGQPEFMKLLLEQIKQQDPMDPMKNTEFASQLAQFSSLDGISKINKNLENILLTQASANNAAAINLIGKDIETVGDGLTLKNSQPIRLIDDSVKINYTLEKQKAAVSIEIFDENNNMVKSISGALTEKGTHTVQWNGESYLGNELPKGNYYFKINKMDVNGKRPAAANISYRLPAEAKKVSIEIYDKAKMLIDTIRGDTKSGTNTVAWDGAGKNYLFPDGDYSFKVIAEDAKEKNVKATELMVSKATEVMFEGTNTSVMVNGRKIMLSDISRVIGEQ